jgi:hypothetical protein
MNAKPGQQAASYNDRIARLAREIWLSEGGKQGRDLEYWLRAERQILAANQPPNDRENNKGTKRKNLSGRIRSNVREHIWA